MTYRMAGAVSALILSATTTTALAQNAELDVNTLDWPVGEHLVLDLGGDALADFAGQPDIVFDEVIRLNGAAWVRLHLGSVRLDGGSFLRVTSLLDGEVQELDARTLAMWSNTTAYFNGNSVRVELIAAPFSTSTLHIDSASWAPVHAGTERGSCGICNADDRVPSADDRFCRIMPVGCSATLYNTDSCFVTAGHCLDSASVLHYNVPASNGDCSLNNPPIADQFPVIALNGVNAGIGNDYGAMLAGTNSEGQTAYERYGVYTPIAASVPTSGDVDITGYGVDSECERSQTQQYHGGPITYVDSTSIGYNVDVTYGNSGSGIVFNGEIIGVVTHCSYDCEDYGTRIDRDGFETVRQTVCSGGGGDPGVGNTCEDAIAAVAGANAFETITATDSGFGEPDEGQCSGTYLDWDYSPDRWFTFTAASSHTATVHTCDTGSYDTSLVIYEGPECSSLVQVACNGDADDSSGCQQYHSEISLAVTGGQTYWVRVGGWLGATGTGTLTVDADLGDPVETGACCMGAPYYCSITTYEGCVEVGGDYLGNGTDCPNGQGYPCETPAEGACCVNFECSVTTETQCDAQGGTYHGDGSNCSPSPCGEPPHGACCYGSACESTTEAGCTDAGGSWQGANTSCSPNPCDVGEPVVNVNYVVSGVHRVTGDGLAGLGDNWTVDVYLDVPAGWRLDAVAGNEEQQKTISSGGNFYQHGYGGPTSVDVNPAFYNQFPDLEWDSRVTIGAKDSSGDPFGGNALQDIGVDFEPFEAGGDISAGNGLWFVLPSEEQGEAQPYVDNTCESRHGVLLARLTVVGMTPSVEVSALFQGSDGAGDLFQETASKYINYGGEQDCNLNEVPDACDIANGTSDDANGNGIPDECESTCPGDADGDNDVDVDDILRVISYYGTGDGGDVDGDDDTDVDDILMVISNYGNQC